MGKQSFHRWYLATFRIKGSAVHRPDLQAFGASVLGCTGLGCSAVTQQTTEEAVVTALLAGRSKHSKLSPLPRPVKKDNVQTRLSKITSSTVFGGAFESGLCDLKWSVKPACSSSAHAIQAILRSEDLQFTGFTEQQLQHVQDDPVGVLHLDYNTFKAGDRRERRPKASNKGATSHASSATSQGGSEEGVEAAEINSSADPGTSTPCPHVQPAAVPAGQLTPAVAASPAAAAAQAAAGDTQQDGAAMFALPELGPYQHTHYFSGHTRVAVTPIMAQAVRSHPWDVYPEDMVVMPDGSLITLDTDHVLGTGGFGKVVPGIWNEPELEVAVKMPADTPAVYKEHKETREKDTWYDISFLPELRALQAAGPHEYLLKCHGWGLHWGSGMPVIVFDRAACSLRARRPLLPHTPTYIYQLLCVLDHLHARGVWHRDIKPENLLVRRVGLNGHMVLQLADLGISRAAQVQVGPQPTRIGTRIYMAPEQDDPALAPSSGCWAKADVWSAGVTLLEMVGGWVASGMAQKVDEYSDAPPCCPGLPNGGAAVGASGSSSSSSSRAAAVSAYEDPAYHVKEDMERLRKKMPEQAQQLSLVEDLVCRMLVVDPEQRPAAADLLDHPFFELGHGKVQLHAATHDARQQTCSFMH